MQVTNPDPTILSDEHHSNYSIFKRIANFVLVLIAVGVSINIWLLNTAHSDAWHDQQASQLGRSLSAYAAGVIAEYVEQQDIARIDQHLQLLATDSHVFGVSVYDQTGQIITSNEKNRSVLAQFILADNTPLVFVEEIYQQDKLLGYLRILLDEQQIMQFHANYQKQLYQQLLVLMLLAGLAGLLVARAYYKVRFRHYAKVKS